MPSFRKHGLVYIMATYSLAMTILMWMSLNIIRSPECPESVGTRDGVPSGVANDVRPKVDLHGSSIDSIHSQLELLAPSERVRSKENPSKTKVALPAEGTVGSRHTETEKARHSLLGKEDTTILPKKHLHVAPRSAFPAEGSVKGQSEQPQDLPKVNLKALAKMLQQRLEGLEVHKRKLAKGACPSVKNATKGSPVPCWESSCNASLPSPEERLQRLIMRQHPISSEHLRVIDSIIPRANHTDLALITGATADHFDESQGMLKSLHNVVFPQLRRQHPELSFRLFYYDLGLGKDQLRRLAKYCMCTVVRFPFHRLPPEFRRPSNYKWKPLLFKAHTAFSSVTMWIDSSIRFDKDISHILEQVHKTGLFARHNQYMLGGRVHPSLLDYFGFKPRCLLSSLAELETGVVAVKSDAFTRRAIVDPWVACAFSARCLCPTQGLATDNCRDFYTCDWMRPGGEWWCHRYDQSALAIILVSLFGEKVTSFTFYNRADLGYSVAGTNKSDANYFPTT